MNPLKKCEIKSTVRVFEIEYIFDTTIPYKFSVSVSTNREGKSEISVISTHDEGQIYCNTIKNYIETGIIILEKS